MKTLKQFMNEAKNVTGKIVNADESPLYKERDKPEEKLSSPEEVNNALNSDATSKRIMAKNIQHPIGTRVGARLNLNVLKNTGVPVLTLHKGSKTGGSYGGEAQAYHHVVTLHNAEFNVNQAARENIATGKENKSAMASVDGEIQDPSKHSFDGVIARFNPKRQHVFVDENGRAIKSAEHVTLHGNRAYLRGKIEYHTAETMPHATGDAPSDAKLHEQTTYEAIFGSKFISELTVRDASGKNIRVKNVPIRMADGSIRRLPPGKSGSSGGGGGGSGSGGCD